MITPNVTSPDDLQALIRRAVKAGADGVQLRQTRWSEQQWLGCWVSIQSLCEKLGVPLILNSPPERLRASADGLHLSAASLQKMTESGALQALRAVLSARGIWLSASCHSDSELALAQVQGLDWVTLSPVEKTVSHPEQAPMGWDDFESLVGAATLPVFALGGMTPELEPKARACGAQGIAAIGAW